jgi:DNA-binding response OmpR family regulator
MDVLMLACILLKIHLNKSPLLLQRRKKVLSSRRETMGSKILIADDSPTVRHLIMKFLDGRGYEIVTTSDSADVVDLIDEINPDLVISDIMMPGMDGYTFLRHIRKEKTQESLPVIIMSTKEREVMEGLFVSYGISGYLQKPFEKEQLVELVEKALE